MGFMKRLSTSSPCAILAVPGDINSRTGGYLFDKHVLEAMNAAGQAVCLLALPGSFPRPTRFDADQTRKMLLECPPDVPIIIDGLAGGAIETSILDEMQAPYIALTHHPLAFETGLSKPEVAHFRSLERANLALAHHVIVTSPYTASLLQAEYGVEESRITIALPSLPTRITRRKYHAKTIEILSVGLIAPRKGHDVLLDALALISDLDWSARIVGRAPDQEYADQIYAQNERLGLASRVRFTGEVSEAQLSSYFASASVFALASRFEGYGIAFAEALAAGLPVVGCDSGAIPTTVPNDAGMIVPKDDPVAFARALRYLLEDPAARKRMSTAALSYARSFPTWDETAKRICGVISAVKRRRHED